MRPISGFDRPLMQWGFVLLSVVLIAVAAVEAIALWRARARNDELRVKALNARLDQQQVELKLAHEQAAREALSLELSRRNTSTSPGPSIPTLTLAPLKTRGTRPPEATVDLQPASLVMELRLALPGPPDARVKSYIATMRNWSTGEVVWTRGALLPKLIDGRFFVTAPVTGDVVSPGVYEIALTGTAGDGQSLEIAAFELGVRARR